MCYRSMKTKPSFILYLKFSIFISQGGVVHLEVVAVDVAEENLAVSKVANKLLSNHTGMHLIFLIFRLFFESLF